jgi:DNA-binding CsgD family transcriptional regulator
VDVSDFASRGDVAALEQLSEWAAQDWREWASSSFIRDRVPRIIVTRNLKVLAVNARAMDVITATKVLSIAGGQLAATADLAMAKLRHAARTAGERESLQLLGQMDSGVLLTAGAVSDAPTEPVTMTLRDTSAPTGIECADLCAIFGLTPGEQAVILGLLSGQSPPEIADQTGRSVLTVRTHLKRAYAKIGVCSHARLFARLMPLLHIYEAAQ